MYIWKPSEAPISDDEDGEKEGKKGGKKDQKKARICAHVSFTKFLGYKKPQEGKMSKTEREEFEDDWEDSPPQTKKIQLKKNENLKENKASGSLMGEMKSCENGEKIEEDLEVKVSNRKQVKKKKITKEINEDEDEEAEEEEEENEDLSDGKDEDEEYIPVKKSKRRK